MPEMKSIAKELQSMGRNDDTILAHINEKEAELLRLLGGSGTINPNTGLREYGFGKWLKKTIRKLAPVISIGLSIFAPGIGTAIGNAVAGAVGATVSATAAAAIGSAVISGTMTAAAGGDVKDVLKSAAAAGIANFAGAEISGATQSAGLPQTAQGAITGATTGATQAALTGGDVGKGIVTGGLTGGAVGAYRDITAPPLGQGIQPSAQGETGLSAGSFDPSQLGMAGGDTTYAGQGLTTPTQFAGYSLAPPRQPQSELDRTGEQLVRTAAGQLAGSLYDRPSTAPTSTSALTSTGLFTPQSIIPTAISGIAPSAVATGRSITEGSEDEATGAWGAKTLRG